MGYLPQGMVNYLALLGWGDGTENEFFTLEDLGTSFSFTMAIPFTYLIFLVECCVYDLQLRSSRLNVSTKVVRFSIQQS